MYICSLQNGTNFHLFYFVGVGADPALPEVAPAPGPDQNPTPLVGGAGLDLAVRHLRKI